MRFFLQLVARPIRKYAAAPLPLLLNFLRIQPEKRGDVAGRANSADYSSWGRAVFGSGAIKKRPLQAPGFPLSRPGGFAFQAGLDRISSAGEGCGRNTHFARTVSALDRLPGPKSQRFALRCATNIERLPEVRHPISWGDLMPDEKNRCWPGYEPVKGKKKNEQGSRRPKAKSRLTPPEEKFRAKRNRQLTAWKKDHPASPRKAAKDLHKPETKPKSTAGKKGAKAA
jgi:hypothetical protein